MDKRQPTIRVYLRVSTEKQDEASQRKQVDDWIAAQGIDLNLVEWTTEKASGRKIPWQDRKIAQLLEASAAGDKIIVTELTRVARKAVGIHTFIESATLKGVEIVDIRMGLRIDGSIMSKAMVSLSAMFAEIEVENNTERTTAALQARKDKGLPIGRQPGAKGKHNKLAGKLQEIEKRLAAKISKTDIAKLMGVSRQTLDTFLKSSYGEKVAKAEQVELTLTGAA